MFCNGLKRNCPQPGRGLLAAEFTENGRQHMSLPDRLELPAYRRNASGQVGAEQKAGGKDTAAAASGRDACRRAAAKAATRREAN